MVDLFLVVSVCFSCFAVKLQQLHLTLHEQVSRWNKNVSPFGKFEQMFPCDTSLSAISLFHPSRDNSSEL